MPKEYPVCVSCLIFVADVSDHAAWIADSHAVGRDGTVTTLPAPMTLLRPIVTPGRIFSADERFACNTFFIFRLHT